MKVRFIAKSGDVLAEGKLNGDKLEEAEVLLYLGKYFRYNGSHKGTCIYVEIKLWDVTLALK